MTETGRMRIDVWLWRTRFYKTRSLAASAAEAGGVRVERDGQVRRIEKASAGISPGDVVSFITAGGVLQSVRVLTLPERRGPAPEAAATYEVASSR
jgi:ribosome-associated heat shock protein Hsp15